MSEYKFTLDWEYRNDSEKIWEKVLCPRFERQYTVVILELGSFEGRSTKWFSENIMRGKYSGSIVCVDDWKDKSVLERFSHNVEKMMAENNMIINTEKNDPVSFLIEELFYAKTMLPKIKKEGIYDIVYINHVHLSPPLLKQITFSFEVLKKGGVAIFDNYFWIKEGSKNLEAKVGIDAFMNAYEGKYKLVHKGWQVIIEKL